MKTPIRSFATAWRYYFEKDPPSGLNVRGAVTEGHAHGTYWFSWAVTNGGNPYESGIVEFSHSSEWAKSRNKAVYQVRKAMRKLMGE